MADMESDEACSPGDKNFVAAVWGRGPTRFDDPALLLIPQSCGPRRGRE
uniref:Uncharacterized protein n=1 Tax=Rhizophora mucronata TaxID=61149 RepID=A0A2P2PF43_RHIMU